MSDPASLIPFILRKGLVVTVQLTLFGFTLTLIIAFVMGFARISKFPLVRVLATCYIEFFRGTSIFVQLFWLYFVLPLFGVPLSAMQAGILALGCNTGAYGAEVVRGAILAVPREQYEACIALNLTLYQKMRHVILPQALLYMLPPLGNNAIDLLKGTAIVSLITLSDITFRATVVRAQTGNTVIPFVTILVIYYLISLGIAKFTLWVEQKMSKGLDIIR